MANSSMDFSVAYQEVAGQLGIDYTDTNTLTRLKRWVNFGYKDIAGFYEWSWLKGRETVTMIADYTSSTDTTTVAVAAAGTTVTFSSTIAVSRTDWSIQLEGADDWYKITAHTAGTATATISPGYIQSTALTAAEYTIRKWVYSLSSSVEYVEDCRQAITNRKVRTIDSRDYDAYGFPTDTAAAVETINFWGHDSSNEWTFTPWPIPSATHLLEFRFIKAVTELSADTDEPIFPARFDSILVNRAKMYGYEFLNDDRMYRLKFNETETTLKKMQTKDTVGRDKLTILKAMDQPGMADGIIPFPSNFER